MATGGRKVRKDVQGPHGLTSKILDAIRVEVGSVRKGAGLARSDYYAKQANPKDGGYAKCNYVKGDGQRRVRPDELAKRELAIRVKPPVNARVAKNVKRGGQR